MPANVETVPPQNRVDTPSCAYSDMADKWELLHDLLGGTKVMRDAGDKWLPREDKESDRKYNARVKRSILYNAFGHTIDKLSGKPFVKPATLKGQENLDPRLQACAVDMDRAGNDLTQFCRQVFEKGMTHGICHILVDYPKIQPGATLADERAAGARPMFVMVPAPKMLGWRTRTDNAGETVLTMVRMLETRVEPSGIYGDQEVRYVRVYTEKTWELWKEFTDEEHGTQFLMVDSGLHTFGRVPLVTFYVLRTGFMTADPPFEDLAWINLTHWQSYSDQRNILRFARCGTMFAAGFTGEEIDKGLTLGPSSLIASTNENASLQVVEHTGAAINAGKDDLDTLQSQMEALSAQPLVEATANSTATGKAIDESSAHSAIQAWIMSLTQTLDAAFKMAAEWIGVDLPTDFDVQIFNEFVLSLRADKDMTALTGLRAQGDLSRETLLNEAKRRGFLTDSLDIKKEMDRIEQEGPPLGSLSGAGTGAAGGSDNPVA